MRCPNCSAEITDKDIICLSCGCETVSGLSMRWHLFLVHIALWVVGACLVLLGILLLSGMQYLAQGMAPGAVYGQFVALNIIDVVYGIVLILLGVLCIITRFRLNAFRKNGPRTLYVTHALIALCTVAYSILSSIAVGTPASRLVGFAEIGSLAGMILGVYLHVLYYKKRDYLFNL
ncbi:MAG: hypothetical protein IKT99_05565 [Oscillospiraceae bacterium]|nr:hypothetical protein [Oscillospiraceae bacterium]